MRAIYFALLSLMTLISLRISAATEENIYTVHARSYRLRSTPDFTADRTNVAGLLTRGSQFQLLERVRRPDGSEAWLIRIISAGAGASYGSSANTYWVYRGNPSHFRSNRPTGTRSDVRAGSSCDNCAQTTVTPVPRDQIDDISAVSRETTQNIETPAPDTSSSSAPPGPSGSAICRASFTAVWDKKPQGAQWSQAACQSLVRHGQRLLQLTPRDMAGYCPNYHRLNNTQKVQFWIYFMSALGTFETRNFNTSSVGDVEYFGNENASIGLFQMSRGDGCPGIRSNRDLADPVKNIDCAFYKLNQLVGRDGVIAAGSTGRDSRGAARYWGPLREPRGPTASKSSLSRSERMRYACSGNSCTSKREKIKQMTRTLAACRN